MNYWRFGFTCLAFLIVFSRHDAAARTETRERLHPHRNQDTENACYRVVPLAARRKGSIIVNGFTSSGQVIASGEAKDADRLYIFFDPEHAPRACATIKLQGALSRHWDTNITVTPADGCAAQAICGTTTEESDGAALSFQPQAWSVRAGKFAWLTAPKIGPITSALASDANGDVLGIASPLEPLNPTESTDQLSFQQSERAVIWKPGSSAVKRVVCRADSAWFGAPGEIVTQSGVDIESEWEVIEAVSQISLRGQRPRLLFYGKCFAVSPGGEYIVGKQLRGYKGASVAGGSISDQAEENIVWHSGIATLLRFQPECVNASGWIGGEYIVTRNGMKVYRGVVYHSGKSLDLTSRTSGLPKGVHVLKATSIDRKGNLIVQVGRDDDIEAVSRLLSKQ